MQRVEGKNRRVCRMFGPSSQAPFMALKAFLKEKVCGVLTGWNWME